MKRVIIVGPGAAGKTTLAARLAEITGLPVIELERLFLAAWTGRDASRGVGGHPAHAPPSPCRR